MWVALWGFTLLGSCLGNPVDPGLLQLEDGESIGDGEFQMPDSDNWVDLGMQLAEGRLAISSSN